MASTNISAIVFDLGNVLIPFNYHITVNKLNKVEHGLGDYFYNHYKSNYDYHRDFEKGKIIESEFIDQMLSLLNHKVDAELFCEFYSNIFELNNELILLLPELKKKYRLYLLSNTDSLHQKYGWEKYSFINYFDELILSHKVGALKPEEKIYRAVEMASGLSSKEHFFIDDILEYVNAAKDIGWEAVQFINNKKLFADLKKFNIIQ